MKAFSLAWKSSKQKSKQIKYQTNAPYHLKGKMLAVHLTKELKEKYDLRSIRIRVGDKVKVLRGTPKGKIAKVEKVDPKLERIYLVGVDVTKKDGSKYLKAFHPSNLMIMELNLDDKKRKQKLESSKENKKPEGPK